MTAACEKCDEPIIDGARWCDPCADDSNLAEDLDPDDMVILEAELDELARTDPAVRAAVERNTEAMKRWLASRGIA